jgi:hypothetical protein
MGWVQFINEDALDFVIMADRTGDEFVDVGELRGMFSPPPVKSGISSMEPNMLRLLITAVQRRETVLPKPIVDALGRVVCGTLGEAYERKAEVWWYESHTVVPNEDGSTHSGC